MVYRVVACVSVHCLCQCTVRPFRTCAAAGRPGPTAMLQPCYSHATPALLRPAGAFGASIKLTKALLSTEVWGPCWHVFRPSAPLIKNRKSTGVCAASLHRGHQPCWVTPPRVLQHPVTACGTYRCWVLNLVRSMFVFSGRMSNLISKECGALMLTFIIL